MNQLIQVIINLINNAKDAIKSNNIENGSIKILVQEKNRSVILSICDNGGGIDKSIKKSIGQPYVSTKSKNGTGLGLYMSIMIVTNYLDGKLYWDSDNKGSCFHISLPIEE
jgi:signal transduction histidine kinase